MDSLNPFYCGNPVPTDLFKNRRRDIRRSVSRIANYGQSTAIVGEPRIGKTSLLKFLADPENRTILYDAKGERLVFSYIDAQTLGTQLDCAQFWELA